MGSEHRSRDHSLELLNSLFVTAIPIPHSATPELLQLLTPSSKIFHLDEVESSGWGGAVCLRFSRLIEQLGDPAEFSSP
jgi:hypothetical protein